MPFSSARRLIRQEVPRLRDRQQKSVIQRTFYPLTIVFLLLVYPCAGQSDPPKLNVTGKIDAAEQLLNVIIHCDSIYDIVDTRSQYDKGDAGLIDYLMKELSPVISDCVKRDSVLITRLLIILTIDKYGTIIDASFPRSHATVLCREEMRKKLLTMTGWTAGQIKGQPVCCYYEIPISCLKWSDK